MPYSQVGHHCCSKCETKYKPIFRGMHVAPTKANHNNGTNSRRDEQTDIRIDKQTDGQSDDGQSDPYVMLCFAGATKNALGCIPYSQHTIFLSFLKHKTYYHMDCPETRKLNVKITRSKIMVRCEIFYQKEYTCEVWKPYVFWIKSYDQG